MEKNKQQLKVESLTNAMDSLLKAMAISFDNQDEFTIDLLKNGQIQKFEYTVELCWKTLKGHFKEQGLDLQYPKACFREFFPHTKLNENEKIIALDMIDDRNRIANEYKDFIMDIIYPKISQYTKILKDIVDTLQTQ